MREIKFRAWNEGHKKMFEVLSLFPPLNRLQLQGQNNAIPLYCVKLMQYTGLHDKNGKEIYEGDIIKTTFFDFYNGKAFKANIGHTCYGDGCYFIMTDGHSSNILFRSLTADNLEVIGNIWENPELLEVAK